MDILMTTDSYGGVTNGVKTTIDAHAEELVEKGHEVTVIAPDQEGVNYGAQEGGYTLISQSTLPLFEVGGEKLGIPLEGTLDREYDEPDVVHIHGPFTEGSMGKQIAEKHDAPVVATFHTPTSEYAEYMLGDLAKNDLAQRVTDWGNNKVYQAIYDDGGWLETLFEAALGWKETEEIVAPTKQASEYLSERIESDVGTLSNGIDTGFFKPTESDFLERYGLDDTENLVGYCGRLSPEKNLEDLVELDKQLGEETEVLVWGGGGQTGKYSELFEEKDINYLGLLDKSEMPEAYSAIDVLVNPSTAETQGKTVLEANSCGTPAVGADAMALSETIEDGINGYNYQRTSKDQNSGEVAGSLHEQINRTLEEDLSSSSRRYVEENHSLESSVDELEELYRSLLE